MSAPLQMNVHRQLVIAIVPKNTKTASWWLESSVFAVNKIANLSVRIEYMCAELWMDMHFTYFDAKACHGQCLDCGLHQVIS